MYKKTIEKYKRLLQNTDLVFIRDIYYKIDWKARLIGIVGQRGVGKTTILLQYLKKENIKHSIYFSADNINIIDLGLYNFVEKLYLEEGIKTFFIDEIHKYHNWNQELKNLYDDFPNIQIVFSGSSSIDLVKGKYDLSRRVLLYKMNGFSFKEYVNKVKKIKLKNYSIEELLFQTEDTINEIYDLLGDDILVLFNKYLKSGYYPFNFESENIDSFYSRLLTTIDKLIYEDISNFYNIDSTNLEKLRKIIVFFALTKPGELSINSIKNKLGVSFDTASNYIQILNDVGVLKSIYSEGDISKNIRKAKKVYIDNSNIIYTISNEVGINPEIGTIREIFFVNQFNKNLFYSKIGDFSFRNGKQTYIFEVGGKNKTKKQLLGTDNSFIISDSIIFGTKNKIPLWLFGFLQN